MSLPKYKELDSLKNIEEVEQEIFLFQKNLFDLRMKRSSNQKINSHLFSQYKHRIAQLYTKKQFFIVSQNKK